MNNFCALVLFFVFGISIVQAQEHFPLNEPYNQPDDYYAFTHATIIVSPNKEIKNGSLVIKNGKIESVSESNKVPTGAVEINTKGKYIYPSFIDLYSNFGQKKINLTTSAGSNGQQLFSTKKGFYWNQHMQAELNAYQKLRYKEADAKTLRNIGFGTIVSHQPNGIARGTAVAIALQKREIAKNFLKKQVSQNFALERSSSKQAYPTSLMGMLALIRQFYADAKWYKTNTPDSRDFTLENYNANQSLPEVIGVKNAYDIMRVLEINPNYIVKTSNDAYEVLEELKNLNPKLIVPLNFPKAYLVENPYAAMNVSLQELRRWNQAPANPKWLAENSIEFALTTADLKNKTDFFKQLQIAIKHGFTQKDALAALTTVPAKFMNLSNQIGTLESNKWANFLITSKRIFQKENKILENWVQGKRHHIQDYSNFQSGKYNLLVENQTILIKITNKNGKLTAKADSAKVKVVESNQSIGLFYNPKNKTNYRLVGKINKNNAQGSGFTSQGNAVEFALNWIEPLQEVKSKKSKEKLANVAKPIVPQTYPNVAFGYESKRQPKTYLIQNATVWTLDGKNPVQSNTDVLIKNGKIKAIGQNLSAKSATVIQGKNMHLTPGIVDEHSHMAIDRGVNEAGLNISSEVRIGDVIKPNDIAIFRQLAGGVTTSQLLHGSANPIGGQSQIIKLKWGESAKNLKFPNAPKHIKFALGENVKQSNWGIQRPNRYPQTRMGVEQLFIDAFLRAKAYQADSNPNKRKDHQLDALVEILEGNRHITCHSYVQSEINMLLKVADSLGFKVNTFTHILEGYKVADKMKQHGANGSTFSDWWAYKFEVNDAIPYNASLMNEVGVNTSINSDDREMARRLNQEAAKTMKYGNRDEVEALKMVTLNPAKMLKIDNKVGSIELGKDADLVLWNQHPLSQYAIAQKTWIDGTLYFDREQYANQLAKVQEERNQLIQLMIDDETTAKEDKKEPMIEKDIHYHCDTL